MHAGGAPAQTWRGAAHAPEGARVEAGVVGQHGGQRVLEHQQPSVGLLLHGQQQPDAAVQRGCRGHRGEPADLTRRPPPLPWHSPNHVMCLFSHTTDFLLGPSAAPRHGVLQKVFTWAPTWKSARRSRRMPPKLSLAGPEGPQVVAHPALPAPSRRAEGTLTFRQIHVHHQVAVTVRHWEQSPESALATPKVSGTPASRPYTHPGSPAGHYPP